MQAVIKNNIIISDILNYKNIGSNCQIHATAIIENGAVIGNNVKIGAYSLIGKNAVIGNDCEIKSHVVIEGDTKIGNGNTVFPFVTIGEPPQDLKYAGEKSKVVIGDNNSIREHCTIHSGTAMGGMLTSVGSNNLLMVNTHVAHDCMIGSNCILANNSTLGGHVTIGDCAVVGGMSAIHQFVRIGTGAMIGGMTGVEFDVIPYGTVSGNRARLGGLNLVGMKRRNISREEIHTMRHFYDDLFVKRENEPLLDRAKKLKRRKAYKNSSVVAQTMEFLLGNSKRNFCTMESC